MKKASGPILVVTGETSGEEHAAGLIGRLKAMSSDAELEFFGSGGPRMAEQGVELLVDVDRLSAIGPFEAVLRLPGYLKLFRDILQQSRRRSPRLAILVDFPDFNLRLAARLKKMGIPVCYYISPQVWAWRVSRVKQIRRYVDLMLVIFPFEKEFYQQHGIEVSFIGNPTVDRIEAAAEHEARRYGRQKGRRPLVCLLPGSRPAEVRRILPIQLDAAQYLADNCSARFLIVQPPSVKREEIEKIVMEWKQKNRSQVPLEIQGGDSADLLSRSDCAIVKSGTSTLEAMLLGIPFAMVYKLSPLSYYLLRPLVRPQAYCLANLVAGHRIVPEFVQHEADGKRIAAYLESVLEDKEKYETVRRELLQARRSMGRGDSYSQGAFQIKQHFFESEKAA